MYPSRTVTIAINRPFRQVYEFLAEPRNLSRWGSGPVETYVQIGEYEWQTMGETGPLRIRFTPYNRYGVVDFSISPPNMQMPMTPARVYANGEGAEVAFTMFQLEGLSDEKFASDCTWLEADLQVLKTYLESV